MKTRRDAPSTAELLWVGDDAESQSHAHYPQTHRHGTIIKGSARNVMYRTWHPVNAETKERQCWRTCVCYYRRARHQPISSLKSHLQLHWCNSISRKGLQVKMFWLLRRVHPVLFLINDTWFKWNRCMFNWLFVAADVAMLKMRHSAELLSISFFFFAGVYFLLFYYERGGSPVT